MHRIRRGQPCLPVNASISQVIHHIAKGRDILPFRRIHLHDQDILFPRLYRFCQIYLKRREAAFVSANRNPIAPDLTGQHHSFKFQQKGFILPFPFHPENLLIAADKLTLRFIKTVIGKNFVGMRQLHLYISFRFRRTKRIRSVKRGLVKPVVIKCSSFLQFSSFLRRHRIFNSGACSFRFYFPATVKPQCSLFYL